MKKILTLLLMAMISTICSAQCWVGRTMTSVNMRYGPSTNYDVIRKLPQGAVVFWDIEDKTGDWQLVTDVKHDVEGYVLGKYLKRYQQVESSESASIAMTDRTAEYNPIIHVVNQSKETISLKINGTPYRIGPYGSEDLTLHPGRFSYKASSPGIIPAVGTYIVESNSRYEWKFYIVTSRY